MESADIKIELKKSVRGLNMMKAEGAIDWPAVDIFRFMSNLEWRNSWDINAE